MPKSLPAEAPSRSSYDVVIVGGAMYGSSVSWFLTDNPDFDGTILVVERDPSYELCSTTHTNSCMRQQFSRELNVRISQFAADFVKHLRDYMGGDERVPNLPIQSYGYLYLADNEEFAQVLQASQKIQVECGAGTKYMTAEEIKNDYPFYNVDDVIGGNHNRVDEGYFDGGTLFEWWRRSGRERGAEYIHNEVVAMGLDASATRVENVTLNSGEVVGCGTLVNASGSRWIATCR